MDISKIDAENKLKLNKEISGEKTILYCTMGRGLTSCSSIGKLRLRSLPIDPYDLF